MSRSLVLAKYAGDGVTPSAEHFEVKSVPAPDASSLADGDILVRLLVVSPDPYMRGGFHPPQDKDAPSKIGEPISGFVAGKVEASKAADLSVGTLVAFSGPYTSHQVLTAKARSGTYFVPLTGVVDEAHISQAIGVLGMPGLTAWTGVHENLQPKAGEVLYVNAAGGVVGGLVAQLAVAAGVKVVASAGTDDKLRWLREKVGVHAAISYKGRSKEQIRDDIVRAVVGPDADAKAIADAKAGGVVDMVFENVGGDQWEAVFPILKQKARVAVCGAISGYNSGGGLSLSMPAMDLIYKGVRVWGHIVFHYFDRTAQFLPKLASAVKEGKIDVQETVVRGLENFGEAYEGLMKGRNMGKMVVTVDA
eukprot:TRINITY_DN59492_c0_g1_i1.p1 TRINITY_DN59492_c0_g1~~TRINITY_DN59492_c0_g1_i1.p1  ORF type:complete len:363 (-),score=89.83 TRINITY_DN59492_c0_g1_i1:239-1327(-)